MIKKNLATILSIALLSALVFSLMMVFPKTRTEEFHRYSKVVEYWSGSAFAISSDGYLATANHVVAGEKELFVRYHGQMVPAKVIAVDPYDDVAIIKINVVGLTPIPLSKDKIEDADPIALLGYPDPMNYGLSLKMSTGESYNAEVPDFFFKQGMRFDSILCGGNSGGVAIDAFGQAKAVVTLGLITKHPPRNNPSCSYIGYGPVIDYVKTLADQKKIPYTTVMFHEKHSWEFWNEKYQDSVLFVYGHN